jgi:hypothetical protein
MSLTSNFTDFDMMVMLGTIVGSVILIVVLSLVNYFFAKEKRRVYIGKWISSLFQVIEVRKVTPFTKELVITKGSLKTTIIFDVGKPTYRGRRNTWVYMVDIDKAQVLLNPQEFKVPNWEYDMALTRGTVRNVMSGINKPQVLNMLVFVGIGLLAGISVGVMIGKLFL